MVQEPHSGSTQTLPSPQDSITSTSQRGLVASNWALQSGSLGQEQGESLPCSASLTSTSHLHSGARSQLQAGTVSGMNGHFESSQTLVPGILRHFDDPESHSSLTGTQSGSGPSCFHVLTLT